MSDGSKHGFEPMKAPPLSARVWLFNAYGGEWVALRLSRAFAQYAEADMEKLPWVYRFAAADDPPPEGMPTPQEIAEAHDRLESDWLKPCNCDACKEYSRRR